MTLLKYVFLFLILILSPPGGIAFVQAQEVSARESATTDSRSAIQTVKVPSSDPVNLDGQLDEPAWQLVPVATTFTQRSPDDGAAATERTEARVIYTEDAIYVGARLYDSAMDSVGATLFRRDGNAYSDWFYVGIDSYNDNRTGFSFGVNPRGVRRDILLYDDDRSDSRWDAVWEASTSLDEEGWTVEMRIPLSQLRFSSSPNDGGQVWGINFVRMLARNEEESYWSPTSQNVSGIVSQYGDLEGISGLTPPKQLEIIPYISANLRRAPGNNTNPFYRQNEWNGSVGADLKYGLTSDITLTATVNPDFGQVEADPAVINLSAYQTFFSEQRPFFLEGNEIFQFGGTRTFNSYGNPLTLYTRRIGRAPQGNISRYNSYNDEAIYDPDSGGEIYTDSPGQTTIAAAAKLSGKTQSGWSVGLLDAYTVAESSPYRMEATGDAGDFTVEPATNYFAARARKDLNGGETILGGYVSSVNRNVGNTYFEEMLHKSAYLGGFDFEHHWDDQNWTLSGTFSASRVNGTSEVLAGTQESPARYYNRVDSDRLSIDSSRTSLDGFATELSIRKSGGDHWRTSLTYSEVSPGYEVNDLGFENRADYRATSFHLRYEENAPGYLRSYQIQTNITRAWNYDGDLISSFYNIGGNVQFENLWGVNINLNYGGPTYLDRLTRGGPVARREPDWNFNFNIRSDQTKKVSFNVGGFYRNEFYGEEYDRELWGGIELRPASHIQLSISPSFGFGKDTDQYVLTEADPLATGTYGSRYVFADIDQSWLSTNIRLDWTFTPDISLQLYTRPFFTSGNLYNYKEFRTPREYEFNVYGRDIGTISSSDREYTVNPDGAGAAPSFTFSDRDFNFRSIQGNTVFRWEYKPGAVLFLVWQYNQSSSGPENDFQLGRDFSRLFDSKPTNIFLVKFSYWLGR